jgi:hypothetical protein
MSNPNAEKNKAVVLEAFDTLIVTTDSLLLCAPTVADLDFDFIYTLAFFTTTRRKHPP